MENKTQIAVLELEQFLKVLPVDEVIATITANSLDELKEAASDLNCRLAEPFDGYYGFGNKHYCFDYVKDNFRIKVKSKESFTLQTKLIKE